MCVCVCVCVRVCVCGGGGGGGVNLGVCVSVCAHACVCASHSTCLSKTHQVYELPLSFSAAPRGKYLGRK